ncbi:Tctex1 domain-containing protein 2 [Sciurus carolinensis]|uniref:Tctex1 domain-containing protein 2 n=1 Tax=Sciurus carolinensis TaxID=30640 RepID=A0AA41MMP2_SCICA|nr:Tctex1 domain-containing protein 2 [Sciurus carolinensis]
MACSRTCSRILGLSLGTAALCAAGANMALFFPNWDVTYLLRGLIGRHAMLGSGLWGGGLMMLTALFSSGLALLGALICFITSGVALKDGPFCMFDVSFFNQTQAWKYGYPFKDLHNRFRPSVVKDCIHTVLKEELANAEYNPEEMPQLTKHLSENIKDKLKEMGFDRYKMVVQVVIGEQRGEGVFMAARCFWDADTDNYTYDVFMNVSLSGNLFSFPGSGGHSKSN